MKVLITGITGLAGGYLARHLLQEQPGVEIFGTYRWRSRMETVEGIKQSVHLHECDVRDGSSVRKLIGDVRPDQIYHLAAQSNVVTSLGAPADTLATNVVGLVNVLEAMRDLHPAARLLVPGSAEEYGLQYEDELPIRETNPLRPLSPYGVSKVAQDMTGLQYAESYGLHIVRTRAFHHTGPGREHVFSESSFAWQIAQIEAGLKPPAVHVGNLEVRRDYSDVRDVVRAYALVLEKGAAGEVYNVCSGVMRSIGDLVEILRGFSCVPVEVVPDPARMREREAPVMVGDAGRLRAATGWEPRIPIEQTLREILDFWRARARSTAGAPG